MNSNWIIRISVTCIKCNNTHESFALQSFSTSLHAMCYPLHHYQETGFRCKHIHKQSFMKQLSMFQSEKSMQLSATKLRITKEISFVCMQRNEVSPSGVKPLLGELVGVAWTRCVRVFALCDLFSPCTKESKQKCVNSKFQLSNQYFPPDLTTKDE